MPVKTQRRTNRFEVRVTAREKEQILRAANLRGATITDFLVTSAKQEAERTLREHEVWVLSEKDRRIFVEAILNPPKPTARALAAAKRYREEIG